MRPHLLRSRARVLVWICVLAIEQMRGDRTYTLFKNARTGPDANRPNEKERERDIERERAMYRERPTLCGFVSHNRAEKIVQKRPGICTLTYTHRHRVWRANTLARSKSVSVSQTHTRSHASSRCCVMCIVYMLYAKVDVHTKICCAEMRFMFAASL